MLKFESLDNVYKLHERNSLEFSSYQILPSKISDRFPLVFLIKFIAILSVMQPISRTLKLKKC